MKYRDEIDIREIFISLFKRKKLILLITSIISISTVIYSLNLPDIYTSKSRLVPTAPEDSLTSKLGGLASFGSLAGVSLSSDSVSKSHEAIERMKSFEFFSSYFLPNIRLEDLMAVKKWIPSKNIIIYDKKLFDESSGKWVRDISYSKRPIPSDQQAYKFYQDIFTINEDSKSLFITVSIKHQSPYIAKDWLDLIIHQINESMLSKDAEQAKKSIAYLSDTAQTTNIQSLKEIISNLLEKEMQTLMLTASNEDYIFSIIDSPLVPEIKSGPSRSVICFLGTIFGFIIAILIAFLLDYRKLFKSEVARDVSKI
jgi:LPS O-antigen subunit length determinant protein (WzzB/FepE family)